MNTPMRPSVFPRHYCVIPYDKEWERLAGYEAIYDRIESCHLYAADLFNTREEVQYVIMCVTSVPTLVLERKPE